MGLGLGLGLGLGSGLAKPSPNLAVELGRGLASPLYLPYISPNLAVELGRGLAPLRGGALRLGMRPRLPCADDGAEEGGRGGGVERRGEGREVRAGELEADQGEVKGR